MDTLIWEHGEIKASLTTHSAGSHYGIPVLRVEHPRGTVDLGPADFAPHDPDELPGTGAALLVAIHDAKPLTGETLDAARRFLAQWPLGPQL